MELVVSTIIFGTIFCIATELIFAINIFFTITKLKKIIDHSLEYISNINFRRSTGKELPVSELEFISEDHFSWLPPFFKNHIGHTLRDKITYYILEEGISSRERSMSIAQKILINEKWFLNFTYDDLLKNLNFLRSLYIPLGSLCALIIFSIGYTKLGGHLLSPSYDEISKNVFIISFTMKAAALTLGVGVIAHITSVAINFMITRQKVLEDLSEMIFQLKACKLKIKVN